MSAQTIEHTVINPRRWGLYASSRQCIVVLDFDTIEDADQFRANPDAAIHIHHTKARP